MIREKIFRLHRRKSSAGNDAFGDKIDFTFSKIQAIQVPKGWDKLSLSLVSSETGKTVRKSGKVSVKNGTCQWTDSVSESIYVSNIDNSKETEQYLCKFIVAMNSSRSGILGEMILNLAAFLSSQTPVFVSMPLKKCNHGTILQVEIRCLTPIRNPRDEKCKEIQASKYDTADHEIIGDIIEVSNCTITKSYESCSSNNFGSASRGRELGSRETSFSSSFSHYSFDSVDDQSFGGNKSMGRQNSVESYDSTSFSALDSPKSERSFQNPVIKDNNGRIQREEFRKLSFQENSGSSKRFEKSDDATIEELKVLRKELDNQCLNMTNLKTELSTSNSECRKLSQEIDHLKILLEESTEKQKVGENLSLHLEKTQESNIELILILQDMEETIERQRLEIESFSPLKSEFVDEKEINVDNQVFTDKNKADLDTCFTGISLSDIDEQIPQENKFELETMNLERDFRREILYLESIVEDQIVRTEIEQDIKNLILKGCEVECRVKERKILNLEAELSRYSSDQKLQDLKRRGYFEGSKEIKSLKKKVWELEKALELQDSTEIVKNEAIIALDCSSDLSDDMILSCTGKSSHFSHDNNQETRLKEPENNENEFVKHLQEENEFYFTRISGLEAKLRYLTNTKESSRLEFEQSESRVRNLENQIKSLKEEIESKNLGTKHKFLEMEKRLFEAREECSSLNGVNIRMQLNIENLIEECNSLQKFNGELRHEKMKLQKHCLILEEKVRNCEVQENFEPFEENEVVLVANQEKVAKSLKSGVDGVDSKLISSELERVRLAEDNLILLLQSQKAQEGQNEILALRVSLKEMESKNRYLEGALGSILADYEELKCEKESMARKISSLQIIIAERDDCLRKKIAMEEKILRLEGDLIVKDALCAINAEMKNEIIRIKGVNSQLHVRVKHLENVKEDLRARVQFLEEELLKTREGFKEQDSCCRKSRDTENDCESRIQLLENELVKALEANGAYESQFNSVEAVAFKKQETGESNETAKCNCKVSLLEAEVEEIRDRYLQISLKYAQVEAQRENLVMKLKGLNCK